jgi:hypothetical protein
VTQELEEATKKLEKTHPGRDRAIELGWDEEGDSEEAFDGVARDVADAEFLQLAEDAEYCRPRE